MSVSEIKVKRPGGEYRERSEEGKGGREGGEGETALG